MAKQSTHIVLSSAEALVYGVTRFEITARLVKMYGLDVLDPKPVCVVKGGSIGGTESAYQLYNHVMAHRAFK